MPPIEVDAILTANVREPGRSFPDCFRYLRQGGLFLIEASPKDLDLVCSEVERANFQRMGILTAGIMEEKRVKVPLIFLAFSKGRARRRITSTTRFYPGESREDVLRHFVRLTTSEGEVVYNPSPWALQDVLRAACDKEGRIYTEQFRDETEESKPVQGEETPYTISGVLEHLEQE